MVENGNKKALETPAAVSLSQKIADLKQRAYGNEDNEKELSKYVHIFVKKSLDATEAFDLEKKLLKLLNKQPSENKEV